MLFYLIYVILTLEFQGAKRVAQKFKIPKNFIATKAKPVKAGDAKL